MNGKVVYCGYVAMLAGCLWLAAPVLAADYKVQRQAMIKAIEEDVVATSR